MRNSTTANVKDFREVAESTEMPEGARQIILLLGNALLPFAAISARYEHEYSRGNSVLIRVANVGEVREDDFRNAGKVIRSVLRILRKPRYMEEGKKPRTVSSTREAKEDYMDDHRGVDPDELAKMMKAAGYYRQVTALNDIARSIKKRRARLASFGILGAS